MIKASVAATGTGRQDLATKADLAEIRADFARLEGRLDAKFAALETRFAAALNRMVLSQLAAAGLLFAALKLF